MEWQELDVNHNAQGSKMNILPFKCRARSFAHQTQSSAVRRSGGGGKFSKMFLWTGSRAAQGSQYERRWRSDMNLGPPTLKHSADTAAQKNRAPWQEQISGVCLHVFKIESPTSPDLCLHACYNITNRNLLTRLKASKCMPRYLLPTSHCRSHMHRSDTNPGPPALKHSANTAIQKSRLPYRTVYQKIRAHSHLDKRKTNTALKAGEDRAILLGLTMIMCSVMLYFVLGITILRSYMESVWTEESWCTVLNSSNIGDMNCTFSCGSDCYGVSKYPCLQVFVILNSSGEVYRLSHTEETLEINPECFYVPKCKKTCNMTVIESIAEHFKKHQQFPCFHDRERKQDNVLLTRLYGPSAVFHSLFWPTCMLIGGTLIITMVKLTQYLSLLCEGISKVKR
ncbi:KCMB2 protein, partial [Polyodon spathula]|nr:KCMB2 protein [Polyodon spathula]